MHIRKYTFRDDGAQAGLPPRVQSNQPVGGGSLFAPAGSGIGGLFGAPSTRPPAPGLFGPPANPYVNVVGNGPGGAQVLGNHAANNLPGFGANSSGFGGAGGPHPPVQSNQQNQF